ncbi:MAG: FAD-dependent monooxygenase [Pirellulaceae bacterium]|nr:FAD-dependent monooxygenase [Pirellulaceae bacterium]
MPSPRTEVLIVGAGPVGLTLAAALSRQGVACRIIDKAPAPSDKSKALVVWSRTLELLDKLGLAETFIAAGMKINGASIYGHGERLAHIHIAGVDSPFGFPLMIPQNETERLLTEHLAVRGILIERQVELVGFREATDAVLATLRRADGREETAAAAWLVGCDGAHSTVRHALEMPFTGEAEQNDWLLADIHVAGPLPSDELSIFWHERGILAFFPITRDRFRVIADLGMAKTAGKPADPTLAEVQAKVDERGPGGLTMTDPVWLAGFRINERKVADYRRGRVMLAGDAAHIHSPAGGQGMNTGMQDSFNLAWKLALACRGTGQPEPLLQSYSRERSAVGDQVLRGAGMMTMVATLRSPLAQFLRNHTASVLTSFSFVQDKIKNALCELSIHYRHSPLVTDDWPWAGGGLAAGERLPDAPLTCPHSGRETTLFAETRGPGHALLLLPGTREGQTISPLVALAREIEADFPTVFAPLLVVSADDESRLAACAAEAPLPLWLDATGRVHEALGAKDRTVVVVRPDGYVGYRGQPADGKALRTYLARYLVAREN